jgi:hypothetical protein
MLTRTVLPALAAGIVFPFSASPGGSEAAYRVRRGYHDSQARSLPSGVGAPESALDPAGAVADTKVRQRLVMMACDLIVYGALLRPQRLADRDVPRASQVSGFMARMHLD